MNLGRLSGSLWGPIAFGSLVVVVLSHLTRPCTCSCGAFSFLLLICWDTVYFIFQFYMWRFI